MIRQPRLRSNRALWLLVALVSIAAAGVVGCQDEAERRSATEALDAQVLDSTEINIKVQLAGARDVAKMVRTDEGLRYKIIGYDGTVRWLTPEQFAERIWEQEQSRTWWEIVMNISSPAGIAWVALGFAAQILFAGRMVVQWLASERSKRSVIPVSFWWMSLIGATMLLAYFAWRKDIIGVLGQCTGWLIYVRNLYMIYRDRRSDGSNPGGAEAAATEQPA